MGGGGRGTVLGRAANRFQRCGFWSGLAELWRQILDNIRDAFNQTRPFLEKTIAPARLAGQGATGNGENLAILFERHARRDKRAAFLGRLDDYDTQAEPRD